MNESLRAALRQTAAGVEIEVWAVPGASRTGLSGLHGSAVKVWVAVPAEGGRANRAICDFLAELTGATVELVRGRKHRRKHFLLRGVDVETVTRALSGSRP